MANSDWIVQLEAVIDNSSLTNAQKKIAKEHFRAELDVQLDVNEFAKQKKILSQNITDMAKQMKTAFSNIGLNLDDKQLNAFAEEFLTRIQTVAKAEDDLANSMAKVREQSEKARQSEEKRQELAQSRAINKSIDDEYKQKQKLIEQEEKLAQAQAKEVDKIQHSLSVGDYNTQLKGFETALKKAGVEGTELENTLKSAKTALDELNKSATADNIIPDDVVSKAKTLETEIEKLSNSVKNVKLDSSLVADDLKVNDTVTKLNEQLRKNTAYTSEAKNQVKAWINELETLGATESRLKQINSEARKLHSEMANGGKIGLNWWGKLTQAWEKFGGWSIATASFTFLSSNVKKAVTELKELDNILTEITKTSDLTEQQLKKLGDTAFESASKYGRKASDYLTGVQEMYRAGFDNAEEMAELSVLAQSAGDMDSTLSNDYIMATNAAYKYKGSVEELNKVLDSQNYITNNAAISMKDIADATTETASVAAQYGVEIDELSALIATATANTRESGSEVGTALKAILINLQDTTSKPVTDTFDALGISMTKVVDGAETLKTPIELIHELADAYNSLPEGDIMRANILNEIGQKRHANTLAAVLSDMESYNKMLELYNSNLADNSAYNEAMKSANNWQGTINKLSNSWSDLVQNFADSDSIIWVINRINDLVQVLDELGAVSTIGLGAGLFAGFKNIGRPKMFGLVLKYADNYKCSLGY